MERPDVVNRPDATDPYAESNPHALREVSLPRRDRIATLVALSGVTGLAWCYLFVTAAGMEAMGSASPMAMLEVRAWTASEFWMMFVMWALMMVAMMLPSAAPMTLIYAAVARKARREGTKLAPTASFVAGYLAMWTAFSLAATLVQWRLEQAALLSPMMVTTSPAIGAGLLIAAGAYQLTPIKNACLEHCRAPVQFISRHWRSGALGAFRMGLRHGAYCLGCCWVLMGLLFFGGVMNLLWIAAITLFVLLEKVWPHGVLAGRISGIAMATMGSVVLAAWL